MLGEDLQESRPTTNMKKGWLCRTSYDEIVHTWWWPVEIQIEQWSRSIPVMMIQIEWWSRSSDDVLWWSRSRDDPDPDDLKTKMTWRRDDPVDIAKKNLCWKLCRKNTFLVKRECWCICNFRMYSSMYFIYCNPMFIPGCLYYVFESCGHALMFRLGGLIM